MPRGDKSAYTEKQKRQAEHIEESERERGASESTAERIAWATVNKQDGGGKRSGSGRKVAKKVSTSASRSAAAKKAAKTRAARKTARKVAAKKAARTRASS
ncbi:hypothetical protein [Stenotrophomonas sp. SMYL86]|uniref:hypothetical protein n=1 Tax=Stenotrophomonas sp. SMYL86 TaxID=3076044 RepID=UPI002E78F7C5|nr:hypothetical protein [Stenotrophomonas sp. SMYL86]